MQDPGPLSALLFRISASKGFRTQFFRRGLELTRPIKNPHACGGWMRPGPHWCDIEQTPGLTSPYVVKHHPGGSAEGSAEGEIGQVGMTNQVCMNDLWRRPLSPSKAAAISRRRFFVSGLAALALFRATESGLHLRSPAIVTIRNGWVLARED